MEQFSATLHEITLSGYKIRAEWGSTATTMNANGTAFNSASPSPSPTTLTGSMMVIMSKEGRDVAYLQPKYALPRTLGTRSDASRHIHCRKMVEGIFYRNRIAS